VMMVAFGADSPGVDGRPLLAVDIVLLFHQGSQKPGMGKDLPKLFPCARRFRRSRCRTWAYLVACFEGPATSSPHEQRATRALCARSSRLGDYQGSLYPHVRAAAGHSLGGSLLTPADRSACPGAARLVRRRRAMFEQEWQPRRCSDTRRPLRHRAGLVRAREQGSRGGGAANYNTDEQDRPFPGRERESSVRWSWQKRRAPQRADQNCQ